MLIYRLQSCRKYYLQAVFLICYTVTLYKRKRKRKRRDEQAREAFMKELESEEVTGIFIHDLMKEGVE